MAIIATVDKFGITFSDAYHKITRLNYHSMDQMERSYPVVEPKYDKDGNMLAIPPEPIDSWIKKNFCHIEVSTYASEETRESNSEPIYNTSFNFELDMSEDSDDVLVQAYDFLKSQVGYEDAVDC